MFFKRIELVGFKSFATKTTIEFLPGVTVIVGPNGCGKSNTLDAIKWVLGSQSPRSLRGKKMEDVIFAGSASFKPLSMAQVTLTVDNSRRSLDIDYDEIQIARRLYRTGESEYLLNKVPCRLRDIHNLLLGTGAGMLSYSVLEQGKVDQIINAKPEERRYIIEEAAGISKFKVRKMEALRKLERTAADLKRLEDLISEVQRQVNSLKRQASKAEHYREISAQLRQADMELIVLRSRDLRGQLDALQSEIAGIQDRLSAMRTKCAGLSASEQEGKDQARALDAKLAEKVDKRFNVEHAIQEQEHQIQRANERIKGNEKRLAQIETEFAEFSAREQDLAQRREENETRRNQAVLERDAAQAKFADQEREHAEMRSQVDEQSRRLDQLNADVSKRREQLSRCENVVRIEETLIAKHEETRLETEEILKRLRETIQGQSDRRAELSRKAEEIAGQIGSARQSASSLQIRHAETHGRIADLTKELETVSRDLHQSEARLGTLEELKSNFDGFHQGVRELMKASSKREIPGIVGPLVNLIKSRREHELAVEVALGPQLQDVVVESAESARAGLDFLSRGELGRVTFLPLDRLTTTYLMADLARVLDEEGVVGHAPVLVEHDPSVGMVVNALLARTLVVKDWETAERLACKYPSFAYVALDGRMIAVNGAITGGNLKSSGLLGREREIHELKESVAQHSLRREELQTTVQSERAAAETLAGEMKSCSSQLHDLEVQKAALSKENESAIRAHEESLRQLADRERQLAGLVKEIESKIELKTTMEKERSEHDKALTETTAQLERLREETRSRNDAFLALGEQLSQARAELEKVRERLVHLEETRAAQEREGTALAADRQSRAEEQGRLQEDIAKTQGEIAGIHESLQDLFAKRERLQKELTEDNSEKEQLEASLKQLAFEMEQLQRDERMIENDLHEKQVGQAGLQANLNQLVEQSLEKFNRDLFEIAAELGEITRDSAALAQETLQLREKIEKMGSVNLAALDEYNEQKTRLEFLTGQQKDLVESKARIEASIAQLDETTKQLFHETFESVRGHFIEMFRRLFNGGKADLVIDQQGAEQGADPLLEGGVEIYAQPPGKKLQTLSLMSGGEKAMTAISLLFGLFLHKPAPFAILDEIDAPLDDANVERFKQVVMEFSDNTQFVIISHNKQTMALADAIYGVTMEESGVSKLVSVQFEKPEAQIVSAS